MYRPGALGAWLVLLGFVSVASAQTETTSPEAPPPEPNAPVDAPNEPAPPVAPGAAEDGKAAPAEQQEAPPATPPSSQVPEPPVPAPSPVQEPPKAAEQPQEPEEPKPPEPPAAMPPAEQEALVSAQTKTQAAPPTKDTGTTSSAIRARNFEALPLSLELRAGLHSRIGASDNGFANEELNDLMVGAAGFLAWNRSFSVGLELEHSGLGRASAMSGDSSVNASYSMTNLWAGTRVYPFRSDTIDLFITLRLGLGLQHLSATGTRHTGVVGAPAQSFSCSEVQGPDLGFSGGLGSSFRISRFVSFFARADAVGQRLSGELLGDCAVGIGSVTSLAATAGLAYEFELDPQPVRSARTTR